MGSPTEDLTAGIEKIFLRHKATIGSTNPDNTYTKASTCGGCDLECYVCPRFYVEAINFRKEKVNGNKPVCMIMSQYSISTVVKIEGDPKEFLEELNALRDIIQIHQ